MKHCPACQQRYADDALRVCPRDGAALVAAASEPRAPAPRREKLFISYSHRDRPWLERLQLNLRPFFRHAETSILAWDDRQIRPGAQWFDEIDQALASACVAVLLVTPDFLASEFINEVELPRLMEAARAEGLKILWVAVRPSAISETEISKYQGLNNPAEPLANLSEAAQDAKLVEICKKIQGALRDRPAAPGAPAAAAETGAAVPLAPLRTFDAYMADIGPFIPAEDGRLWVANAQQAKVFRLGQEQAAEARLLPRLQWKRYLPELWHGRLLVSDWGGSLHSFSPQGGQQEPPFYQRRHDDLPIHLLATGPGGGQLWAAAWNGLVRAWDADGRLIAHAAPIVVPHAPVQLLPLAAGGGVAVADQSNCLRAFDAAGAEVWARSFSEPLRRLLPADDAGRAPGFVVQEGDRRLLKLTDAGQQAGAVEFDAALTCVAKGTGRRGEEWIVAAREGGKVDWLSASLFSVVRDNSVTLPCEVRRLHVVHDPQQPASLIALGLGAEGQLFTINEREVTLYAAPRPVDRLALDRTGRFLFLLAGQQLSVCRNPAVLPARLRVELAEPVAGRLVVDGFKRVTVRLRNTGDAAIHQIKAELSAPEIIDASRSAQPPARPLAPGETMALEFHVRAKMRGDLPLMLRVELADEGGPPVSACELSFHLESVAPGAEE